MTFIIFDWRQQYKQKVCRCIRKKVIRLIFIVGSNIQRHTLEENFRCREVTEGVRVDVEGFT